MVALAVLAGAVTALAAKTWNGSVSTNWADAANWDGGLPGNGDDIVITNTTMKPYMPAGTYPASGTFGAFCISNGATVTCLGDTNSVNGGSVAVPYGTGVAIRCQSAVIAGTLSADGQGFPYLKGPGYYGSHGGRSLKGGGITYGSLMQPSSLGSGGLHDPAPGGGAIRLIVDGILDVRTAGIITAAGVGGGVGAAGGSLWITAGTLTGGGTIRARGANIGGNPSEGGGGGGRVALDYSTSTFTGIVSVAGGTGNGSLQWGESDGQAGTLWEPQRFENVRGTPENPVAVTVNQGFQYYFTNTVMRYWNLTVTNGAWFEVHNGSMALSGLTLSNSTFNFDTYASNGLHNLDMVSMSITGNVSMTGASFPCSRLWLPSMDYVFNTLSILAGSSLYLGGNTNAANGGSAAVPYGTGVTIRCQTALINGRMNADSQGFPSATGPGYANSVASYGGRGGGSSSAQSYGSLTQPGALGSGGYGTAGGGAIRLITDGTITLNGAVSANGQTYGNYGGAGGSLWLTANTLAGTGTVTAIGGGPEGVQGGGGGRVALEYSAFTFTGVVNVAGGSGSSVNNAGKTGTLFKCSWTAPGALPPFGDGVTLSNRYVFGGGSSTNSSTNGVMITRMINQWVKGTPKLRWTETSTDLASNQQDSVATYGINGLPAGLPILVYDNQNLVCKTNSGTGGTMGFSVTLSAGAHVIEVKAPATGMTIMIR